MEIETVMMRKEKSKPDYGTEYIRARLGGKIPPDPEDPRFEEGD